MRHGVCRHEDGLRLAVWAPRTERLQLSLRGKLQPLAQAPDGWWTADLPRLPSGTPYALVFPDGRVRPDPAARAQEKDVHGPSAVFDPAEFRWTDGGWSGVPLEALAFYELHVGTFTEEGTLDGAAARLPELVDLGITCVELMPVQPFGGVRNWGYDGVLLHAVHGAYGGPAALQRFVDRAHALGLGVCLDVVYNHLGPEGNYLGEFGPYTTSRHRSPWGDGMNYDGPESGPVRGYMVQAARSWVEDFHVDALRLDAVHAIVDDSQFHLVQEIAGSVHQASGGRAWVIAESDLNDRRVVDPPPTGWGCDAAWADDFHHAVHALLTGERSAFYADFGEPEDLARALEHGFVYQGQPSRFRQRPHGTSTVGLLPRQFVTCLQNHDQVGNRPTGERIASLVPREALEPLATLLLLGPGLPLLFMGEEHGETRPFLYFTSHTDPELGKAVSEGRRAEFIAEAKEVPDPQAERTFRDSRPARSGDQALRAHYRQMLAVRRRYRQVIASSWPRVRREGRAYRLERPGLTVTVNLGAEPALGLPAWGWEVLPR
ncbi:MAG TPA: malto-oligosyltrehalose trehalohydrolase [Myxococcaceae bacterium]|nr:malto-oligosyltrehalose trehalohydrolase [Myxococcaceae bacterium]